MINAEFTVLEMLTADFQLANVEVVSADLTQINNDLDALAGEPLAGQALAKIEALDTTKAAINAAIVTMGSTGSDIMSEIPAAIEAIPVGVDPVPIESALDALAGEVVVGDSLVKISAIDTTKAAINAAIVGKGQSATDVMSEMPDRINSIKGAEYERPEDWLPISHLVSAGQEKVVGLVAVFPDGGNHITFRGVGAYNIDFGDGNVFNVASNTKIEHELDYSALSVSTESSRGYRQAIVTVTPQVGNQLTSVSFVDSHDTLSTSSRKNYGWLDIKMSAPNLTTLHMSYNSVVFQHAGMVESFEFVGSNFVASLLYSFHSMERLIKWRMEDTSSVAKFRQAWLNCRSLRDMPATIDSSSCAASDFESNYQMFSGASALRASPSFIGGSMGAPSGVYAACSSLQSAGMMNLSSTVGFTESVFGGAINLIFIPAWNLTSITSAANMPQVSSLGSLRKISCINIKWSWSVAHNMLGFDAISEIISNLVAGVTSQTLTITGNPGAAAIMADIAASIITVPTGWTIVN